MTPHLNKVLGRMNKSRQKFHKMAVASCSKNSKALEQGELDLVCAVEPVVPAFHLRLGVGAECAWLFQMLVNTSSRSCP